MRRLGIILLALALLLIGTRLFTGIYRRSDSGLAYFVLKPAPDFAVERDHAEGPRFDRAKVLDDDEMDLAYGPLYRGLMAAAPWGAVLLAGAGLYWGRRR